MYEVYACVRVRGILISVLNKMTSPEEVSARDFARVDDGDGGPEDYAPRRRSRSDCLARAGRGLPVVVVNSPCARRRGRTALAR